jgi:hypothetical protein
LHEHAPKALQKLQKDPSCTFCTGPGTRTQKNEGVAANDSPELAELRDLVPAVCHQVGEEDVETALALALADPGPALEAYRYLAGLQAALPLPDTDNRQPCAACRNLSPSGRCLAAFRGELPGHHRSYSPAPDVPRRCERFVSRRTP